MLSRGGGCDENKRGPSLSPHTQACGHGGLYNKDSNGLLHNTTTRGGVKTQVRMSCQHQESDRKQDMPFIRFSETSQQSYISASPVQQIKPLPRRAVLYVYTALCENEEKTKGRKHV